VFRLVVLEDCRFGHVDRERWECIGLRWIDGGHQKYWTSCHGLELAESHRADVVVVIEVGRFDMVGDQAEGHLSKVETEPEVYHKLQGGREQRLLQGQCPDHRLEEVVYLLCEQIVRELEEPQGCRLTGQMFGLAQTAWKICRIGLQVMQMGEVAEVEEAAD
jgi:hypothetical protein